ncbi:hypothetical protein, partial [Ruegeria sp. SCP11]|uniref:hypothetical protein n=1 Tax=Ruegeria sp. SCP11 TaxID=3141378 RepID=UPI003334AEEE
DRLYVYSTSAWSGVTSFDGGGGSNDRLRFFQSSATFDLTSVSLSNVERLYSFTSNSTLVVDDTSLADFTTIRSNPGNRLLTNDTSLDLTGKSVQNFTVESGNATGTTFTVNSKATAFQIRGGAGSDTVDATG